MGCGVFTCKLAALLTKSFNNFTQFLKIFFETKKGKTVSLLLFLLASGMERKAGTLQDQSFRGSFSA